MPRGIAILALTGALFLCSCGKKEGNEPTQGSSETPQQAAPQEAAKTPAATGPHATVHLKDGGKVSGSIVASTQSDMVVAGDNGIEQKIPLSQIKSVDYGEAEPKALGSREPAPRRRTAQEKRAPASEQSPAAETREPETARSAAPGGAPVNTATYQVPAGSQISVRTNEGIDSATATEGQTFDAQVTRDVTDESGAVVIPRGSDARIAIKSASSGGRIRGASDLVLDLQSVTINGKRYVVEAADVSQTGKQGVGANKRTATYTGGGAALGALIGAIAGGGKGAAIGAGAGAGAGVLTQVLTKGGAIKVPPEAVLTFKLDKPLLVHAAR